MAKDPAFLFYSQDFIVGVQTMNFEDRGKYITVLSQMHQQGRLDEDTIKFLIGDISISLKNKFKIDKNGKWYNKRLEDEIEKRRLFVDSRRKNGQLGGRPKKPTGKPNGKAKGNLTVNENEDVNDTAIKDEKDKKIKYSDNVRMTQIEYEKLVKKHGKENTEAMVMILCNYKGSKGKTYKSDYKAVLSWVIDSLKEKGRYKQFGHKLAKVAL